MSVHSAVELSIDAGRFGRSNSVSIILLNPGFISRIVPAFAPINTEFSVTIYGSSFSSRISCVIGGFLAKTSLWISEEVLVCTFGSIQSVGTFDIWLCPARSNCPNLSPSLISFLVSNTTIPLNVQSISPSALHTKGGAIMLVGLSFNSLLYENLFCFVNGTKHSMAMFVSPFFVCEFSRVSAIGMISLHVATSYGSLSGAFPLLVVEPPVITSIYPSVWDDCGNSIFYVTGYGFETINSTSFRAILGSIQVPLFVFNATIALGVSPSLKSGSYSVLLLASVSDLPFSSHISVLVNRSCIPDISLTTYTLPFNLSTSVIPFGRWTEIWRSARCIWTWDYEGFSFTNVSVVNTYGCSSPKLQHPTTLSIVFAHGDNSFSFCRYILNLVEQRAQAVHPAAFQQLQTNIFTIHGRFPMPPYNVSVTGSLVRSELVSSTSLRVYASDMPTGTLQISIVSSLGMVPSDQSTNVTVFPRFKITSFSPDTLTNRLFQDVVVHGSGFSF
jgi:hypothetical protein